MHPSRAIRGGRSQLLAGRRIVLGVTGSIAAVEAPRIARELIRHGADVIPVMSPEASRLVTPEALQFATGHAPILQLSGDVEHVTLLGPGDERADLLLIAPATANTISKVAHGIDDTPVTSCASMALGGGVPVLVAPAMHAALAANPAVRESLQKLAGWGVGVIAATSAEGEEKLATPEEVAAAVLHRLARGPLAGRRVLVVGGASRESIDDVRSITNESSGATAIALATEAHYRGAEVRLWAGAMQVAIPSFLATERWRSVEDLSHLVRREGPVLAGTDLVLVPAALSDFTLPSQRGKISSRETPELQLRLVRAAKILPELRRKVPRPALLVGFKLEADLTSDALSAAARSLLKEADLDFVVANDRAQLGSANAVAFVHAANGTRHWLTGTKPEFAGKLLDDLARVLAGNVPAPAASGSGAAPRHRVRGRAPRARRR